MTKLEDARNNGAARYRKSIESEEYAAGRSEGEKYVEGLMVGLAYSAGWDEAVKWLAAELQRLDGYKLKEWTAGDFEFEKLMSDIAALVGGE